MRGVRERLCAIRVELLHFLWSWEKHELRQDWLRRLRCRHVFSRRAFNVRVVLRRFVQCGGSVELPDVRRGEKHERREDQLQIVRGREI